MTEKDDTYVESEREKEKGVPTVYTFLGSKAFWHV